MVVASTRRVFKAFFVVAFIVNILSSVSAIEIANFTQISPFFDIGQNNTFNVTIGAINNTNITMVVFSWVGSRGSSGETFIVNTNGTTAVNVSFSNISRLSGSTGQNITLNFSNSSGGVLIPNGTTRIFWFDLTSRSAESSYQLTINVTNESGGVNSTVYTVG